MTVPICPDCGSSTVKRGAIPQYQFFAGRNVSTTLQTSDLYQCTRCSLAFRWPSLDKQNLDALYQTGSIDAWNSTPSARPDWNFAERFILKNISGGRKILDVGCFNGDFLAIIKNSYSCAGIEINSVAVERAIERGINIIGSNFSDLIGDFNCITAFDVIEHVESPRQFIKNCLDHIVSGGYLIISTGNADSFSFKLMGSKYWYAVVPEHIAFISPTWFNWFSNDLGFTVVTSNLYSRRNTGLLTVLKEAAANLVFKFSPWIFSRLRAIGLGNISLDGSHNLMMFPPGWGSAVDHFVIVLRKS
jgi:2-polyprenyl-3-methyl-5-hydroxy-6-metoxy-1,4-benzoquinol methylase